MPIRRLLPGESSPDVADLGSMMGPLALPGAVGGTIAKVGKALIDPDTLTMLHELLGVPLQAGRRMLRLSSVAPDKGLAILHADDGERVAMQANDLVQSLKSGAISETEYLTPRQIGSLENSGRMGERIEAMTKVGPRGGTRSANTVTAPRRVPKTATR